MRFAIGRRVKIASHAHEWNGLHAVIVDDLTADHVVVSVTAHGMSGRYAFPVAEHVLLCKETIVGHNGTYTFPCVRVDGHDGSCNRVYPSGGPCDLCGCDSHDRKPCAGKHCGSAPCVEGLTWDAWHEKQEQLVREASP
jgi:hypothetical protein